MRPGIGHRVGGSGVAGHTYWTRKQHGRTIARLLTAEQIDRYQPQIDNARRLRQLVTALETFAITTPESTEKWGRK